MHAYREHRVLFWVGGIFATLIVALFIASFFLDDLVRARTQAAMNQKLKGYHVALGSCAPATGRRDSHVEWPQDHSAGASASRRSPTSR